MAALTDFTYLTEIMYRHYAAMSAIQFKIKNALKRFLDTLGKLGNESSHRAQLF